jgi:NTE family protein
VSVALVLSGGGARGAYEIGALSVLLPELERRGEQPRIVVGTSVGAFNAAFYAANVHRPLPEAMADGVRLWSEMRWRDVLGSVTSLRGLARLFSFSGQLLGLRRPRIRSLLDPAPLEPTLARAVSFERIARNIEAGQVQSAAVTATSAHTGRTVVFQAGGASPPRDELREIDYVAAPLDSANVRASGAIPGLFPAVHVPTPGRARGWYFDGGTRLNTPIKPALALGAERVVVIGLNSIAPAPPELAGEHRPDVFEGTAQIFQGLLIDRLVDDMRELAAENAPDQAGRRVPYVFVAPRQRDEIGAIAARVYNERFAGIRGLFRDRNLSILGRIVAGGDDAIHGELLSFLLFAPEFLGELIALGKEHAREWLAQQHDDGPWRTGPLPG